jgi:hypothetical protein
MSPKNRKEKVVKETNKQAVRINCALKAKMDFVSQI